MALASTDPRVLMGQAKCFACLTPHQQYILRTYLLALIAMGDTSITGVQALSAASTCFACLTYEELLAAKQYLMAVWLGLDTTKTGIIAQAKAAACDFACLTPKQAEQLRTYLLAVTAGVSTTAAGVRTLEAAAKCFNCLESKQQLEAQVYLLSTLAPGSPTTPAAIMQGAKCYLSCVPPELHEALQTSLFAQVAGRSTPPCVTPTAPGQPSAFSALNNILKISWTQPANSGSLIQSYTLSYGTTQGGPYTASVTVQAGTKQAILNGLTSGTTYYFVVKANSFTGCSSANSAEGSASTTGTPPISPVVTDWSNRVVANGGAQPSNATILAADAFYKGLQSDGIDGLMIAVNMFAPDSLIAALTPLIKVAGNDPWTNHNFVAGNITTGGLAATGGGLKYLQTGVNLNTALANNNDVGYTMYGMATGTSPQNTMIAQDGAGDLGGIWSMTLIAMYNGWDFNIVVGAAGQYMMVSGNRTAANAEAMYSYNSIQGFVVNGTAVTAPATRPTVELYMGCWNQNGVAGQFNGATQTYSFCAIHHGLTQAQANAFALRIQTLRTAFGGGFS